VEITFDDNKLEKLANDFRKCQKEMGQIRAKLPYRLIFQPHQKPTPVDENGQYIWLEVKGVKIIEITNYHRK